MHHYPESARCNEFFLEEEYLGTLLHVRVAPLCWDEAAGCLTAQISEEDRLTSMVLYFYSALSRTAFLGECRMTGKLRPAPFRQDQNTRIPVYRLPPRTQWPLLHRPSLRSPPFKHRLPLLRKRHQRLIPVLSPDNPIVHDILHALMRALHSPQRRPNSNRSPLANLSRKTHSLTKHAASRIRQQLGRSIPIPPGAERLGVLLAPGEHLDQPVRDTQEVRLGGRHAAAREDEVPRARDADERGEAVRAARAGDDAEAGLGEADEGVGREHAEVRR